jgi:hypothetical protein
MYTSFLPSTEDVRSSDQYLDQDDNDIGFDEDEDEFGLPSIASMRRKGKKASNAKTKDYGGFGNTPSNARNANGAAGSLASWAFDNGDVAEERTLPTYPSAKKVEGKILRPQYKDILRDPANSLHLISHPPVPPGASGKELEAHSARITRINKFKKILQASTINVAELRDVMAIAPWLFAYQQRTARSHS